MPTTKHTKEKCVRIHLLPLDTSYSPRVILSPDFYQISTSHSQHKNCARLLRHHNTSSCFHLVGIFYETANISLCEYLLDFGVISPDSKPRELLIPDRDVLAAEMRVRYTVSPVKGRLFGIYDEGCISSGLFCRYHPTTRSWGPG